MKKLKYVLKRFSKPSQQNILDYVHCKPYLKFSFIQIAKIRKITLSNPICEENPLSRLNCTCPDFRDAAFCLHSLAVLIKLGSLKEETFIAQKKKGRKPKAPFAWEQDDDSEESDTLIWTKNDKFNRNFNT